MSNWEYTNIPKKKQKTNQIRNFTPDSVKIEHIKKVVLLLGDDEPGITMRMEVFQNVLESEVGSVEVFENTEEALQYLRVGNLFSPDVNIIIKDVSASIKTTKESKAELEEFLYLISQQSDASHIVLGLVYNNKQTVQMKRLIQAVKDEGGIVREVILPKNNQLSTWISNYAKSSGYDFSPAVISNLLKASDSDPQKAADAIDMLGNEVMTLSLLELSQAMNLKQQSSYSEIQKAIYAGDMLKLSEIRKEYPEGQAGDRIFINKTRYIILDILSALSDTSEGMFTYIPTKRKTNPRFPANIGFATRRTANETGGYERYSRMYLELSQAYASILGFNGNKPPIDLTQLLLSFR